MARPRSKPVSGYAVANRTYAGYISELFSWLQCRSASLRATHKADRSCYTARLPAIFVCHIQMTWLQIRFTSPKQLAPALDDLLMAAGAVSTTMEDAADQPLFEPPPGTTPLWDTVIVTGLFEADADTDHILLLIQQELGQALPPVRVEVLEDKDWVRAWQDNYHPMQMGKRLWIVPSWTAPPEPTAVNLLLDPGLAFGTGTHPTTALCLEWLDGLDLSGKIVLDYGCGSGVLGIAALLLGAAQVWAIDNDPQAVLSTRQNAERNGVSKRLQVGLPGTLPAGFQADVTVSNILAGPLVMLAPTLVQHTRSGGWIGLSGLISRQVDEVRAGYQKWSTMHDVACRDDWCRLAGLLA